MKIKIVLAALCGFLLGVLVCLAPQVRYIYFQPYQNDLAFCRIDRLTGGIWIAGMTKDEVFLWTKLREIPGK